MPPEGESAAQTTPGVVRQKVRLSSVVIAAAAVLLFAWFVRRAGPADIWDGLRSIGWGFAPIIAVAGMRFALRAWALLLCLEPPARLPFASAFAAVLAGDAIGNLTPLGLIASEPTKAAFIRESGALRPAVTAVAIETLIYTLSVAAMIAATTIALLLSFNLPADMRNAAWVAVALILLSFIAIAIVVWRQPTIVGRVVSALLPADSRLLPVVEKLHALEQQILTFAARRRDVLVPVLSAEIAFHTLGVFEIYLTVWLVLGFAPPLLTAFILEGANRLVQVVFKPVPLRTGVDEITTGTFTQMLGYTLTLGTTMAIVRKVRTIFWVLVGTVLLVRKGVK